MTILQCRPSVDQLSVNRKKTVGEQSANRSYSLYLPCFCNNITHSSSLFIYHVSDWRVNCIQDMHVFFNEGIEGLFLLDIAYF